MSAQQPHCVGRLDGTFHAIQCRDYGTDIVGGTKPGKGKDRIYIDDIWIVSKSSKTPFATGDARKAGWGKTNLGLYGSSYVGILAGIVNKTSLESI